MSTETPMVYSEDILALADMFSTTAMQVEYILGTTGVSTAALGAIMEEYNDRFEGPSDIFAQAFGDAWSYFGNSSHADILASYNYVNAQTYAWRVNLSKPQKLLYPILFDVGAGNIQVFTAINLLEAYNRRFQGSDPLDLKKYNSDYARLAADLDRPFNTATVKFASLMVETGLKWGASNVSNWSSLSDLEKQAFAVYFYNVGEDFVESRRDTAIQANGAYNVNIGATDIAQEYLMNYANIMSRFLPNNESLAGLRALIASGDMDEVQNYCFAAGTAIEMADGSRKPIETIVAGDMVLSFDGQGALVPGRVARVFAKRAPHVLDFHGTMVTPGHVYLCAAGRFAGQYVPLIDILRSDGAVMDRDGAMIRAATGDVVGSDLDKMLVWAAVGQLDTAGKLIVRDARPLRLGTRLRLAGRRDLSLADLISALSASVTEAGLIRMPDGHELMFHWRFSDQLPQPEDYVLSRSGVDLDAIFAASNWDEGQPRLPYQTNAGKARLS